MEVGGKPITLSLWDTAGQEDYDRLRPLSYPGTDVFMVCYSMVDPESLKNAKKKWINELQATAQSSPIMLVGTKQDLVNNSEWLAENNTTPVSTEDAKAVQEELGLYAHMETSALTQYNLKKCFDDAIIAVMKNRDKSSKEAKDKKKSSGGFCSVL